MKEPEDELRQAIALFRYGVIADLAHCCFPDYLTTDFPDYFARYRS